VKRFLALGFLIGDNSGQHLRVQLQVLADPEFERWEPCLLFNLLIFCLKRRRYGQTTKCKDWQRHVFDDKGIEDAKGLPLGDRNKPTKLCSVLSKIVQSNSS
jgi:hypothetical protein